MEESNSLSTKLHMADTSISYIQDKQEQPKVSSLKKREEEASETIYFPQIHFLIVYKEKTFKKN